MGLRNLFRPNRARGAAGDLYRSLVSQSRSPQFYTSGGVADTLDGRFDLVALHVALVMTRLKSADPPLFDLSQSLFDEMVANFDVGLREAGVGDMGVGKRMKKLVQAYFGRAQAYEEAVRLSSDDTLMQVLERNLFRGQETAELDVVLRSMTDYVSRQYAHLLAQQDLDLAGGRVDFQPFKG
jgi:cytochrome b pre-mRNA-processing protein 3